MEGNACEFNRLEKEKEKKEEENSRSKENEVSWIRCPTWSIDEDHLVKDEPKGCK